MLLDCGSQGDYSLPSANEVPRQCWNTPGRDPHLKWRLRTVPDGTASVSAPQRHVEADVYFAIVPEWILDSDISAQAVRLYAVLRRYADATGACFPSRKTLATRLKVESPKTVDRAIKELVDIGALVVEARRDETGDQTSNLYLVLTHPWTSMGRGRDKNVPGGRVMDVPGGRDTDDTLTIAITNQSHTEPESTSDPDGSAHSLEIIAVNENEAEAHRLCLLLADRIEANGYKRPAVTREWVRSMDRLIRLDGREPWQIEKAIEWALAHDFWSMNIRSPQKLREQYDRLRAEAARQTQKQEPRGFAGIRDFLTEQGDTL